jgi:hypothetical protein
MPRPAVQLLDAWIARQIPADQRQWLGERASAGAETTDRDIFITLGLIPRRLGRADLDLGPADLEEAEAACPGWDPRGWSIDGAARVMVLLQTIADGAGFPEKFQRLCRTADAAEAIAFYRGLSLYPGPERLEPVAAEGVRSSITAIFEAVAHNNPYPRNHFDEHRWNHMVLKALFNGSALVPIQGLDERANPELALMLRDYAHERWAADRPVAPGLWRCFGPFATSPEILADLARVLASENAQERAAGALALATSPSDEARRLLATAPDLRGQIEAGTLTWKTLAH